MGDFWLLVWLLVGYRADIQKTGMNVASIPVFVIAPWLFREALICFSCKRKTQHVVIPAQAGIHCNKKRSRGFPPARE
ncbi:MAG: hypothetical protein KA079_01330 [Brachymonas sp.]|nr:hypothetical protein [Brachymonas sp.]